MRISIEHITRYIYQQEASYSVQSLRLTPAPYDGLAVLDWQVGVEPAGQATQTTDGFGNTIHLMTVTVPHREIVISARGLVEVADRSGVVHSLSDNVSTRIYLRRTPLTALSPGIVAIVDNTADLEPIPRLHAMMGLIRDKVDYLPGTTHAQTTAAEALEKGAGVCQDHAHILIAAARAAGLPARYVTGYLLIDDEESADAHHAWAEVWVEALGWVGFDVANRTCPTDRYVRMAAALDADHAAPIRGSRRGGEVEKLDVVVHVQLETAKQ